MKSKFSSSFMPFIFLGRKDHGMTDEKKRLPRFDGKWPWQKTAGKSRCGGMESRCVPFQLFMIEI